MLGDRDIQRALDDDELKIDPLNDGWLQPTSIDLRLDRHFLVPREWGFDVGNPIDPAEDSTGRMEPYVVTDGYFRLEPGSFALGATHEHIELSSRLAARIEGKSSLGRLGLVVHSTAGFIDPGFSGQITLELFNLNHAPILLWPGMKIAQLCLFQLMNPVNVPYGSAERQSRYQDQVGPTASRSHLNFTRVPTTRDA